ncbi:anti-adapter protein IraD [Weissella oryzae SG25]|uniref:Adapter protein MecA n=1 Tax=Weissella oryzae (strain DSM 25784 / JCM 18191 / LMG 30913 / SG25) TaxID=1329250 RepID=A0A069CYV4_WEIOS|nr:adaptor protein MecA [Weissella oryzae]GAK30246.1 anti-adapter protein IraD [Weissella oryzae SG25]
MEMERINEDTIRVVVTNEDLAERSMSVIDLLGNQEEIEHFFYSILEEVDIDHDFENNEAVTFQVLPNRNGLEVFISKSLNDKDMVNGVMKSMLGDRDMSESNDEVSDEILEQLLDRDDDSKVEQASKQAVPAEADETVDRLLDGGQNTKTSQTTAHIMMKFNDFENVISFAKMMATIPAQTTLYELKGMYYMEFLFSSTTRQSDIQDIMAVAREYGEVTPLSPDVLTEHGKVIFTIRALALINQYFK